AQGKLQAIEALLEMGSSLNHKNAYGKTALELAFKAGEYGAVNMLKLHGAEVPSYVQEKLDKMNVINTNEVLPSDIITPPNNNNVNNVTENTETQEPIQPMGPVFNNTYIAAPDQNENYV